MTSQVTISVRPVNDNPIALDDFYLMVSGDVLHANVLDNDADRVARQRARQRRRP
ncbi:MAG: hypothetical protein HY791_05815 [Deltaproteobacteria bacterium]|nr:hypothetical protein [Deltaproteobacteria bacterium]